MITCSNPSCRHPIQVQEAVSYVVCPACGNFNFLDDSSSPGFSQDSYQSANYGFDDPPMPPSWDDGYASGGFNPSPAPLPETDLGLWSGNQSGFQPAQEIPKKRPEPGYLLTSDASTRFQLKQGRNLIGRSAADIVIQDRTVSRSHCILEVSPLGDQGYEYHIYDIGLVEGKSSTNGVFISSKRSQRLQNHERFPLSHGDQIRIGEVTLSLHCL